MRGPDFEQVRVHCDRSVSRARERVADPRLTTSAAVLSLQRLAGNESVEALLGEGLEDGETSPVSEVVASGGGAPLDPGARSFLEDRLRSNFSDVRVHTGDRADESARSINAQAYTVGANVVFRSGAYRPDTPAGRHVLAHELAHVLQQRAGPVDGSPAPGGIRLSHPSDSFEQAAERAANEALTAQRADEEEEALEEDETVQTLVVQRQGEDEEEEDLDEDLGE